MELAQPPHMNSRSEELCWLRSRDGRFLSAGTGGIVGTIAHVRSWEWFTLIVVRDRIVVIMTHQGTFLCVVDEDVRHHHIASEQADSFQFEVVVVGGGVTLRNVQTRGLLSALPGTGDLGVVKCVSSGFADGERGPMPRATYRLSPEARCPSRSQACVRRLRASRQLRPRPHDHPRFDLRFEGTRRRVMWW
jgi:hypothetical protein